MFLDYQPVKITTCSLCKGCKLCQWKTPLTSYVCEECLTQRRYTIGNTTRKGEKQKRLPTFSLEFEVESPPSDDPASNAQEVEKALILLRYQFVRTSDGTVADEYKSPLYHSLCALYPALAMMGGLTSLVGDDCGTHLHVECYVKNEIRRYRGELFGPLLSHLLEHQHETLLFWGRVPNDYASHLPRSRYFLFNADSCHPTLEYRLPRFRSKEQYLAVIKFACSATAFLEKHLPLVEKKPDLPAVLGAELLSLYLAHVARACPLTWLAALPCVQQEALFTQESVTWQRITPEGEPSPVPLRGS